MKCSFVWLELGHPDRVIVAIQPTTQDISRLLRTTLFPVKPGDGGMGETQTDVTCAIMIRLEDLSVVQANLVDVPRFVEFD
jgi:hypothetical protein